MPQDIPPLGELEVAVLEHVWAEGSATVKTAHEAIGRERGISLNTVQSTLDRLHRKAILGREKWSRAFHYFPRIDRETLLAGVVAAAARRFGEDPGTAIAALVDAAERIDAGAIDELERLIARRRATQEHPDE